MKSRISADQIVQSQEYIVIDRVIDRSWYLSQIAAQPDENFDSTLHYILVGHKEGKSPLRLFDTKWYVRRYPQSKFSGLCPFGHYLIEGYAYDFSPHPLFDPKWYKQQGDLTNLVPALDYLDCEAHWKRSPHPLFEADWYIREYQETSGALGNPLLHYLSNGFKTGYNPCRIFDTTWYLRRYPEVMSEGRNPLIDYVDRHNFMGRDPNPLFFSEWYLLMNGDVAAAGINPLIHYVTSGWRESRDPSPYFDSSWYRAQYPEADRLGLSPLAHYMSSGGKKLGVHTRPVDRLTHDCDALDVAYEILRSPDSLMGSDVCVFVCYAANGTVADYVCDHLIRFSDHGFKTVLVIVTEGFVVPLDPKLDFIDGIITRLNHGWDFAAWATALAVFPDIWSANLAILTNDSIYGPLNVDHFGRVIADCRRSSADIVALTDSYQVKRHLMSYFTAITRSGLKNKSVRTFWNSIRSNRDKSTVIREYEIRSIERWTRDQVTWSVIFPSDDEDAEPINPTLAGWQDLAARGFPYLKVQLLREFIDRYDAELWPLYIESRRGEERIRLDLERRERLPLPSVRPVPTSKQRYVRSENTFTYYGAVTAVRPSDENDLALEIPIAGIDQQRGHLPDCVAVIAHVFYVDLLPRLLNAISNIPTSVDLFLSTDSMEKSEGIRAMLGAYDKGRVDIRVFPNVGRDIAPLVVGFSDVFDHYEIFLHLHTKKSTHDPGLRGWADYLIDNLAGTTAIVRSILTLMMDHEVGCIYPQHFPAVRSLINFGYNYDTMSILLKRCGVDLRQDWVLEFPSGSFFWMRSDALRPLLALNLTWADFPEEAGQVDGTLAHAIERSLLYLNEAAGFRWAKVATAHASPGEMLVPVRGWEGIEEALDRVHRPLLNNRVPAPTEVLHIPEQNLLFARKDRCERLRLTILVPTLQPSKAYGGIATALQFFEELGAEYGPEIDLRIVSVSERVDLHSMIRFPHYRLLPISAVLDKGARIVVDASERQRGFLGLRRHEVLIATSWWTAKSAFALGRDQERFFGKAPPAVYLIQDHEPGFYANSAQYAAAQSTYSKQNDFVAILNSEELANYFAKHYEIATKWHLPFSINREIKNALAPAPRERIILVYGRPSVERNCFSTLVAALSLWQRANPVLASQWRIVSAGESYEARLVLHIRNIEIAGKLSLEEYGDLLSRASIGISLMMSPHPSYPPLEMAYAGLKTITNTYAEKNLSLRSPNIVSVETLDPQVIAETLARSITEAEAAIGTPSAVCPLSPMPCSTPVYGARELARHLAAQIADPLTARFE